MLMLARDIGTDTGTKGHSDNITASAAHSLRRHNDTSAFKFV